MTEVFKPDYQQISSIASGTNSTTITTTTDHNFVQGNRVYFQIPKEYGMFELNGLEGNITAITNNTLTIDIITVNFSSFSIPAVPEQLALVLGLGNTNFNLATDTVGISGAYRSITE